MNKEQIQRRAQQIGKLAQNILLHEDDTDECAANAFKWAYLILRRPRKFLENFKEGDCDLRVDPHLLRDFVWQFQDEIDPPNGLLPAERDILEEHNREAAAYMNKGSKIISLVRTENNYR